jgi:hypothetical protein
MKQATQPVKGRGTVLTAVALAVALVAALALAPLASAASNPVAAGSTTTIQLNSGFTKKLKKSKVKLTGISPGAVKGKTVTLPIEEGTLDPAGQGELTHEGGLKFKHGKKTVKVTALVLSTTSSSLTGKLAGKSMKIASVTGVTATRSGFGTDVAIKSLKLTGKAAKELNKKLGFTGKKKKKKGKRHHKRAQASKKKKKHKKAQPPFKGNQVLGGSTSTTDPKTIGVLAQGSASLTTNEESTKKFVLPPPEGLGVTIKPIAPTTEELGKTLFTPVLKFPITGGNIAPNGMGGVPQTSGGAELNQKFEALPGEPESTISLANIWVDLTTKRATAEVTVSSTVDEKLNLGPFGRTSIANLDTSGATIKVDEAARTITVENAAAVIEETTAEVMNGVFGTPYDTLEIPHPTFKAGDSLGTFSFTATTE